jgi:hypothetical protein
MSNIFELNQKLGFTPPIEFQQTSKNYSFQFGRIKINKLIQKMNQGAFVLQDYHYLDGKIVNISTSNKTLKSYFLENSKRYPKNFVFLEDQYKIPYKSRLKEYFFETFISNKRGHKISKNYPTFSTNIILRNKTFKYRILFPFEEQAQSDQIADQYGVVIQANDFEAFEVLIEDMGLDSSTIKDQIIRSFNILFADAKDDRNKLDEIYEFAPNFVIQSRGRERVEIDLKNILKGWVNTYGTNEEIAVVNMLTGIFRVSKSAESFLDFLLEDFDKKYTYQNKPFTNIEIIISKIGGEALNEFGVLLQAVWRISSYSNRNNNIFKSTSDIPTFLPYRSNRTLGFYHDNVDAYMYNKNKLRVTYEKSFFDLEFYDCHPYFPIGIPVEQKGDIILGNQIPAIMLYIKDSKHFWNNVVTSVEYAVDIITLVSGYGAYKAFFRLGKVASRASNLTYGVKVARYARVKGILKLVTGVIEVSSSTIRLLLRAANLDKTETGKDVSDFLFYLELLALGGDLRDLISQGARKHAKKIINNENRIRRKLERVVRENDDLDLKDIDILFEEVNDFAGESWRFFDKVGASNINYTDTRPLSPTFAKGGRMEDFEKAVDYLDEIERKQYEVFVQHDRIVDINGELIDTSDSIKKDFFGNSINTNKAIFIMSKRGTLYISKTPVVGKFHHSSFLKGGETAAAGEIIIEKGIIKLVTDNSGHYQHLLKTVKNNLMKELNNRYYFSIGKFNEKNINFISER